MNIVKEILVVVFGIIVYNELHELISDVFKLTTIGEYLAFPATTLLVVATIIIGIWPEKHHD